MPESPTSTNGRLPLVSVVFLAYNRREALSESVRRMTTDAGYPADRLEVIVVDNASNDGTAQMVREEFPEVRLVETGSNLGAPAWNQGFAISRGDYVLILDDDAYLDPGGLELAVRSAQSLDAGLVSFSVVSSYDKSYRFNDEYPTGLLSYWGCAALVSRSALDALGGYDPAIFIWGNELEFTMRLLDRGFVHLYLPEVNAVHMKKPDPSFNLPITLRNYRHFSYVAAKLMTPVDASVTMASMLLQLALGTMADDRRRIQGVPEMVAGLGAGLRNRSPLRPVVSHTYRHNWRAFAWPWRFLRSPVERWQSLRRNDAQEQRRHRERVYFKARPSFYPVGRGSLKL